MTHEIKAAAAGEIADPSAEGASPASIVTRMSFGASPEQVWKGLMFYEEIGRRPPAHLRLLLPVPIRTEGKVSEVGGEAMCLYEGGHLLKRITRIEVNHFYEFEVAEQALSVGGGMRLSGGRYTLQQLDDGTTEVAVETRYLSTRWPRWFWRPLEKLVCHWFHRYLLRSMRRAVESQ